jgi:hypothetical protein
VAFAYQGIRNPVNGREIEDVLDDIDALGLIANKGEGLVMNQSSSLGFDGASDRASVLNVVEHGLLDCPSMHLESYIIQEGKVSVQLASVHV